jgi:nicotinate-nucleotide adenylyltransferase
MAPARIGLFGGTFDPVHVAHVVAAVDARHAARLDTVLLVVANEPWQKTGSRPLTPAADRLAMVAAAVEDIDGLEASGLEIDRGGPSYTVDTLEQLGAERPGAELFLVVGTDVAAQLDSWKRVDDVRALASLVVVTRPGQPVPELPRWRVVPVEIPALDISASAIRRRLAEGRPIDGLVPPGAVRLIRKRGLYAGCG